MINSELYKAIFSRRSIRKYEMTPLTGEVITKLKEYADNVKPLDENIKYEFAYLSADEVKNTLSIKSPHYICIYSEKKDGYLMNAGFLLQQIDLYLSANNIASCWFGMAKPSKVVPKFKNGMEYVIMLAFGNTSEKIHRTSISEFNRNELSTITTIHGIDDILEPVRIAPSASNTQTWFFSGTADEIIVSRKKLNIIKEPIYGAFNQIDIGIALCHLSLSLENKGKTAIFDFSQASAPKGYEYMIKVRSN